MIDSHAFVLTLGVQIAVEHPEPIRILELGTGFGSTPLLQALIQESGTDFELVSLETDATWHAKVTDALPHGWAKRHKCRLVDPAKWLEQPELDEPWSLAFVDNAPGESRVEIILRLQHRARLIVVHDTEAHGYELWKAVDHFTHRITFRGFRPWTTILTDDDAIAHRVYRALTVSPPEGVRR